MKIFSENCQIKNVFSGKNKKGQDYQIVEIQEAGGTEFGAICTGIEGMEKLPQLEKCQLEAEVRITKFGVRFLPETPPKFRFQKATQ